MLDQVRTIDASRIVAYCGSPSSQEYEAIAAALQKIIEPN
jgi:mRNA interferase MazF